MTASVVYNRQGSCRERPKDSICFPQNLQHLSTTYIESVFANPTSSLQILRSVDHIAPARDLECGTPYSASKAYDAKSAFHSSLRRIDF
ncbi:MAG: hypothetical protein WCE53_06475 [Candidatus Acidiferrum sp.]